MSVTYRQKNTKSNNFFSQFVMSSYLLYNKIKQCYFTHLGKEYDEEYDDPYFSR